MNSTNDMTVGSPLRAIIKFAIPLILGYILQQMYLIIDAAIVGRWIGVGALAAVGASSSIMFLIMGFCNGSCAGFAIPVAQAFGARDYAKMRAYVSNSIRIAVVFAVVITFLSCIFCGKILHLVNTPKEVFDLSLSPTICSPVRFVLWATRNSLSISSLPPRSSTSFSMAF